MDPSFFSISICIRRDTKRTTTKKTPMHWFATMLERRRTHASRFIKTSIRTNPSMMSSVALVGWQEKTCQRLLVGGGLEEHMARSLGWRSSKWRMDCEWKHRHWNAKRTRGRWRGVGQHNIRQTDSKCHGHHGSASTVRGWFVLSWPEMSSAAELGRETNQRIGICSTCSSVTARRARPLDCQSVLRMRIQNWAVKWDSRCIGGI